MRGLKILAFLALVLFLWSIQCMCRCPDDAVKEVFGCLETLTQNVQGKNVIAGMDTNIIRGYCSGGLFSDSVECAERIFAKCDGHKEKTILTKVANPSLWRKGFQLLCGQLEHNLQEKVRGDTRFTTEWSRWDPLVPKLESLQQQNKRVCIFLRKYGIIMKTMKNIKTDIANFYISHQLQVVSVNQEIHRITLSKEVYAKHDSCMSEQNLEIHSCLLINEKRYNDNMKTPDSKSKMIDNICRYFEGINICTLDPIQRRCGMEVGTLLRDFLTSISPPLCSGGTALYNNSGQNIDVFGAWGILAPVLSNMAIYFAITFNW